MTLFCCLIFGIIGIVNASKVNSAYDNGDYEGALKASNDAKKWATWGAVIGLIVAVVYCILIFTGAIAGGLFGSF